jgi:hypothetical protein
MYFHVLEQQVWRHESLPAIVHEALILFWAYKILRYDPVCFLYSYDVIKGFLISEITLIIPLFYLFCLDPGLIFLRGFEQGVKNNH